MSSTRLCMRTTERKKKDVLFLCGFTMDFLSLLQVFLYLKCWNIEKDLKKSYKKICPLVLDIKDIHSIPSTRGKIKKSANCNSSTEMTS